MKLKVNNFLCIVCLLGSSLLLADATALGVESGQSGGAASLAAEPVYPVSDLKFSYIEAFPRFPTSEELGGTEVALAVEGGAYVSPREGLESTIVRLDAIGADGVVQLDASAVNAIADALRQRLEDEFGQYSGARFFVAADSNHIDPHTGLDLRRPRQRSLGFLIEYTGPSYQIDGFQLEYLYEGYEGQPSIDELMDVQINLVPTEDAGYVAWRPGVEPIVLTFREIQERPTELYSAAGIQQVLVSLRDALDRQLLAIVVIPDQEQLAAAQQAPVTLPLTIVTGIVSEVRTLAAGERIEAGPERVNHPAHARIRERSPVQPHDPERQLLRRDRIDDYVFRLGRHPGRRVDVAIAPGEPIEVEPGVLAPTVNLDYLVTENRPWTLYGQISNTGTRSTGRWRQRFGLLHNQLSGNDDVLNIDYQTAGFDDVHSVMAYYDFPLFDSQRLRGRVYGHYSEFDASEVGFEDLRFTGQSWSVGAELAANVYQRRELFVDLVLGARYLDTEVENFFFEFPINAGRESFFLPYIGLRLERNSLTSSTFASLMVEGQFGDVTDVDRDELNSLGRLFPDRDWVVMRWDAEHSFFLEPLLNRAAWEDPETPESSTLAHEIALAFRGQYAFDQRLIPQMMMVAGGFYSVRGYPESVISGDTVIIGSAEYRFHLPRVLGIDADPQPLLARDGQPFRWRPQHVYGSTDWDLILRGFIDVGHIINSDPMPFERDETIIGTGLGVELQIRRNINLRMDWGIALSDIDDRYDAGSSRVHFVGTFLF